MKKSILIIPLLIVGALFAEERLTLSTETILLKPVEYTCSVHGAVKSDAAYFVSQSGFTRCLCLRCLVDIYDRNHGGEVKRNP